MDVGICLIMIHHQEMQMDLFRLFMFQPQNGAQVFQSRIYFSKYVLRAKFLPYATIKNYFDFTNLYNFLSPARFIKNFGFIVNGSNSPTYLCSWFCYAAGCTVVYPGSSCIKRKKFIYSQVQQMALASKRLRFLNVVF